MPCLCTPWVSVLCVGAGAAGIEMEGQLMWLPVVGQAAVGETQWLVGMVEQFIFSFGMINEWKAAARLGRVICGMP